MFPNQLNPYLCTQVIGGTYHGDTLLRLLQGEAREDVASIVGGTVRCARLLKYAMTRLRRYAKKHPHWLPVYVDYVSRLERTKP